jgi:hydroxymethylglutaryl-CoA reductase
MLIVHLIVDVRDTMGANYITKMAEGLAGRLEDLSDGGTVRLRILSNLPIFRVFRSEATWSPETLKSTIRDSSLSGEELIDAILDAWAFADADPFRAATNNKGIMNGIDAVTLATGNDFRAIESGAHAFASYNRSHYSTLTRYERTSEGNLKGIIEIPLALGTAGGATAVHPGARLASKILGVTSADELGMVVASVGLAQNFAALRALVTEGVMRGHLRLHAKSVAVLGGASGPMVDVVANLMALEGNISPTRAKQLLSEITQIV